jgi:hypothetical protein
MGAGVPLRWRSAFRAPGPLIETTGFPADSTAALRDTELIAIARFAMHRREHIVIVRAGRSGLLAHTLYFSSEVLSCSLGRLRGRSLFLRVRPMHCTNFTGM